jgi:hypothetical protein
MTISPASVALPGLLARADARISLPAGAEFASKLTLGQIIKGRVLRQQDGGRYLVSFEGSERVVDSSVPLRTGELLQGRVLALGDRVELERVGEAPASAAQEDANVADQAFSALLTKPEQDIDSAFGRARAPLDAAGREIVASSLRRAEDTAALLQSAVALAKLGLQQQPLLLQAVYRALRSQPPVAGASAAAGARSLAAGAALAQQIRDFLRADTGAGADSALDLPAEAPVADSLQAAPQSQAGSAGDTSAQLGKWLLNAQTQGSVAHRVGTLPLLIGNRLVEVDVAMFEQSGQGARAPGTRHRQLVFVLNTERLGRVELSAALTDDRARIRIAAQSEGTASYLAEHTGALRSAVEALGWRVDELTYETHASEHNAAVRAVVEHMVSQDSLDRKV